MAFVAGGARIVGSVELGDNGSVWFNAVLRAEKRIVVGAGSNVQDCAVVHSEHEEVVIGENCSLGHGCVVDDSRLGGGCLVGLGVVVFGARLGRNCLVAAGSVVLPGDYPDNSFLVGSPAKRLRDVSEENLAEMAFAAKHYRELAENR